MMKFQHKADILLPSKGSETPSFVYITASSTTQIGASTTSDSKVVIFDSQEARIISTFRAHNDIINGIQLNDNAQFLVTCGDERTKDVMLWDLRTTKSICRFDLANYIDDLLGCRCASASRNGVIIAAGCDKGVLSWDVRKPEGIVRHVNVWNDDVSSIAFHPYLDSTFLAGDDDGRIVIFDIDEKDDKRAVSFRANDGNPVFQCGFCGTDDVFTLRRTAGAHIWNIIDNKKDVMSDDIREETDNSFGYPVDAHWIQNQLLIVGGDSEGGFAIVEMSRKERKLLAKIENGNKDCINCSHIKIEDEKMILWIGGDAGHLSFWTA